MIQAGMTLSGIYTWHWFPEVPSSHRGNSSPGKYLRPHGAVHPNGKKRPARGWVTRHAEAEGCCWPIMHGIRETTS